MKRMLSLILAAALLILCTLPAGAISGSATADKEISQDIDVSHTVGNSIGSNGGSQDVDVYHTINGGYMITIPEGISLAKNQATTSTVELGDVKVGGTLTVALGSANYNGGWQLTSRAGTLPYSIKVDGAELANNGTVLSCPDGTEYATKDISFSLTDATPKTVSYTDILTFTVSVVE